MKNPEVQRFIIANGFSELKEDVIDVSPYSCLDGSLDGEMADVEYSEALGKNVIRRKKPMAKKRQMQKRPQRKFKGGGKIKNAFNTLRDNISERQKERLRIRDKESDVNAQIAQSMNIAQANDAKLLEQLQTKDPSSTDKKTPMSTTTKVLIGVGVFTLLGVIGYVIYKRKTKKNVNI